MTDTLNINDYFTTETANLFRKCFPGPFLDLSKICELYLWPTFGVITDFPKSGKNKN